MTPTTEMKRQRPIPETYHSGGWEWRLLERTGPWAIYTRGGDSYEVVRTTVNPFPPHSDLWGAYGFSFCGTGSLQRARDEVQKLLVTKRRLIPISQRRPCKPKTRGSVPVAV